MPNLDEIDTTPSGSLGGRKPIERMTPDELCLEGRRLQKEMSVAAERLSKVYDVLYHTVRRGTPDYATSTYLNLANVGKRLTGMISQGLRRTASFDRVLAETKRTMADQAQEEQAKQARKEAKAAKEGKKVWVDPLTALFGPDLPYPPVSLSPDLVTPGEMDELYGEEV
jgi:hypothetical protein